MIQSFKLQITKLITALFSELLVNETERQTWCVETLCV